MAFITWDEKYSVNIQEIDNQHKGLIGLVNDLHNAMQSGKGKDALEKILSSLIDYTKKHFSTEEKLMDNYKYPGYLAHRKEHENLTNEALKLQEQYLKGDITLSIKVSTFLKEWLNKHILGTDRKYSSFFNNRGVK